MISIPYKVMFSWFPLSTMITKLRSFVRPFLKEASNLFEMHIYTKGSRAYAYMAELLDPEKEYFTSNSRIISCEDHSSRGQKKCLNLVRGSEDSNVLILDDTREAWTKDNHDNMIVIRRYRFFKYSSQTMCLNSSKSLAELKTDENEYLEHILQLLKQVHAKFFAHKLPNKSHFGNDVRQVLKTLRKQVLKGCEIVFDCRVLTKVNTIWKMAEEMGATCFQLEWMHHQSLMWLQQILERRILLWQ